ncbi:hypothetical protein HY948_03735 [Candidatus Gottesmanbacteria bacterium]|nr:hypothetical protein [Candidatus Gottesmanbacteria bacterium]
MMQKGKLIVLEGTDGSGKRTQLDLLTAYFQKKNIPYKTLDFPRYTDSFFGALAGDMLHGRLGPVERIPAKLAALPYACDRWQTKDDISTWLDEGNIVIGNRYTASSAVYQAAKLSAPEQPAFINWIYKLEQEVIGLPKEDIVLYFYVPVAVAQSLVEKRGLVKDQYEQNQTMLKTVETLYGDLAKRFSHWQTIDCVKGDVLLSRQEIHEKVLSIINQTIKG